ncbi:transposase [Bacilli bacterium PM5-3]|nr:transposase [Bacilli bacterium PM5-3]MDH6604361.1 transposase [Bacilli bacterium PM5-9]
MKGVILTVNENKKYKCIKSLVDNNGNKYRASVELGVSPRTINRYIKKYKQFGKAAFRHKAHDLKPANTIDENIKQTIIELFNTKYTGFNFKHFNEFLNSNENIIISYSALYNLLTNAGFISKKARRKTKRNHKSNKSIIKLDSVSDEVITIDNEIPIHDCHPRQERAKYFGEIIQMDASQHLWFGDTKAHLHLAIDDATGKILSAFFDKQETLKGYYTLLYQILLNYGIPYMFLTDNRTIFNYNSLKYKKLDKDTFTQFSFACSLLGTDIETTSIPQSKGKVERSFNTHQDRLISELNLMNITTIEEANMFLEPYIEKHNKLFSLPINNIKSVFEKQPNIDEINCILATRYERTIDKGNSIKFFNKYYQPYDKSKLITLAPKSKCMVIKSFDGTLYLECGTKTYQLFEVKKNKEISKRIDTAKCNIEEVNKSKAHTPNADHTWKHSMIKKHQEKLRKKIPSLEEFFDDCQITNQNNTDLEYSIVNNLEY